MTTRTLRFIEDPGHGWLEVPVADLVKLGIENEITPYSYKSRDGKLAYLEEDCDLSTYARAKGYTVGMHKWSEPVERVYQENTHIRSLPSYSPPMPRDAWSGIADAMRGAA